MLGAIAVTRTYVASTSSSRVKGPENDHQGGPLSPIPTETCADEIRDSTIDSDYL